MSFNANCRSAAAATRSGAWGSWAHSSAQGANSRADATMHRNDRRVCFEKVMSDTQDHHFGGFDQRCGAIADLQAQFSRGIGGDDRGDVLLADRERYLR